MRFLQKQFSNDDQISKSMIIAAWSLSAIYGLMFLIKGDMFVVYIHGLWSLVIYPLSFYLNNKQNTKPARILFNVSSMVLIAVCCMMFRYEGDCEFYFLTTLTGTFLLFREDERKELIALGFLTLVMWKIRYLIPWQELPESFFISNISIELLTQLNHVGSFFIIFAFLSIFKFKTERLKKDIERKTKEGERINQQLQRTEATANIGSWSIDLNTNENWMSDETFRIYGVEVGNYFDVSEGISFYHPEDQPKIMEYVNDAIMNGVPYSDEFRFINAQGENMWVRASGSYFEDQKLGIKRLEGSFQDITVQKKAELAKEEFLSVVSHEMRTPLMSVIGLSEVLQEGELDDDSQEMIGIINSAGHAVLSLVNDVLDFSKLNNAKLTLLPTEGSLKQSLRETLNIVKTNASNKEIKLVEDFSIRNNWIVCDFLKLRQVLLNFLSNSIKFTDEGRITLTVKELEDGEYFFLVEDTGCGMSADFIPKIFEVFEQDHNSKRVHAGTGLGMNISQRLIQLMGGKIEVQSELEKGSRFFFTIKLKVSEERAAEELINDTQNRHDNLFEGLHIAYADDNPMNQKVVTKMLAKTKIQITNFPDGQEIVNWFEGGNRADMIIMDIQMPILDGIEATKSIRYLEEQEGLIPTPIIAFSAFSFEKDIEEAKNAGCSDHIAKPIKKADLIQKIKMWTSNIEKKAS